MESWQLPPVDLPPGSAPDLLDSQPQSVDNGWKDELNLAEFPIAALTDRIPDGQTTLVFEDKLERRDNTPIVRRLTIMGTHKHGLPTSLDDEVLVGLIQLTKRRSNFTDAKVQFSRYELIELLGWAQSGQSYRRIEEALHRWVGVVLMYENAWWDNTAKSWVDENFHVLDNVTLYDRERRRSSKAGKAPAKADEKKPQPLSSFRWNEVIFQSFQSGNLKQLDLEFYLRLRLPTTKRLFRFLDKRFYRRDRLDFDLKILACEHVGMSRSYAPTELKRRLKPALEELEEHGFLEPMTPEERYGFVSRGNWRITLARGPRGRTIAPALSNEHAPILEALKARGVTPRAAAELVDAHPVDRIETKIAVFDWLLSGGDKRIGKNPAGYLVASIRDDYQAPGDYPSPSPLPSAPAATPATTASPPTVDPATEASRRRRRDESRHDQLREDELRAAWQALSESERISIQESVKAANPGLQRWKAMLEPLCLTALEERLLAARPSQKTLFPDDAETSG